MMRIALAFFICLLLLQVPVAQTVSSSAQSNELEETKELNRKVVRLYKEGKLDEALQLAKRVLQIREKLLEKDHQLILEALLNLGELTLAKQLYRESLSYFERVLKLNEKQAGPDDASNVVLLNKMAFLRYMIGDSGGSENLYKRVLAINEKSAGAESEQIAQAAFNLAEFYRFTNSYQKAEPLYRRALEIRDKNLKPDDETVMRTANRFRCLYYQSEQEDKLKAFDESRAALYKSDIPNTYDNLSGPVGGGVINGKALSLPKPSYPKDAKAVHATGIVVIEVTIDENGKVVHAEDMCGGNSSLIKAATEAAYQARFTPTLLSGVPVKVSGIITYKFEL